MPLLALNRPAWPPVSPGLAEAFAFSSGNRVGQALGKAVTLAGGAAFLPGMFGNAGSTVALVFDGSTSYGEMPLELGAFGTGAFSVTALVAAGAQAKAFLGNNRNGTAGGWLIEARPDGTARINSAASFATYATTSSTVFDGSPHFFTFAREGAKYSWFVDGVADTTVTTTAFDVSSGFLPMIGAQRTPTTPGNYFNGACVLLILHRRAISIAEHRQLRADLGRMLLPPPRRVWLGDGQGGQTVAPDTDRALLTGYVPTVTRTSSQVVAPAAGHLVANGYQPTVVGKANQVVTPATGHAVISGKIPSIVVSANRTVAPSTGHAVATGYQPTVARSANQTISPATAHAIFTGGTPVVVQGAGRVIQPSGAHIVITGDVPTVGQSGNRTIAPATGHASVSGHVPVIAQTSSRIIVPSGAHLVASGYVPSVSRSNAAVIAPMGAHLVCTGRAPLITQSGNRIVSPASAHVALTGHVPTVQRSGRILEPRHVLSISADPRTLTIPAESRRLLIYPD